MPTNVSIYQNYNRWVMEASVPLSSAGAVGTVVGQGATCVKSNTGLYTVTISNPTGLMLSAVLNSSATLRDAAVGTIKDVGVKSVTQDSTTGAIEIVFRTVNAAGADTDEATDALVVDVSAVIQTGPMTAW